MPIYSIQDVDLTSAVASAQQYLLFSALPVHTNLTNTL